MTGFKVKLFGFGFNFHRYFCGGVNSPIGWYWCLALYYRTPWVYVPSPDARGYWGNWYCSRNFYFGKEHAPDRPENDKPYRDYLNELRKHTAYLMRREHIEACKRMEREMDDAVHNHP